jgi:hypothetical protein
MCAEEEEEELARADADHQELNTLSYLSQLLG